MNIFYLHEEPAIAAAWHCDKHCVKMILETAQILSTAHHVLDGENTEIEGLYRPAFVSHPSTVWARSGLENYKWLHSLPDEYKNVSPKKAYLNYYLGEKMHFARWNYTTPPPWA